MGREGGEKGGIGMVTASSFTWPSRREWEKKEKKDEDSNLCLSSVQFFQGGTADAGAGKRGGKGGKPLSFSQFIWEESKGGRRRKGVEGVELTI